MERGLDQFVSTWLITYWVHQHSLEPRHAKGMVISPLLVAQSLDMNGEGIIYRWVSELPEAQSVSGRAVRDLETVAGMKSERRTAFCRIGGRYISLRRSNRGVLLYIGSLSHFFIFFRMGAHAALHEQASLLRPEFPKAARLPVPIFCGGLGPET